MVPDALSGGPHFAAFCEHYIRQTKGRWAGRPLVLEGWEREFWWEALELDPATGLRIYNEVGLGIPTKNGKSTQASAGGLYGLVADGEAEPEVYLGAATQRQASSIILKQARSMGLRSPALARLVSVQAHTITCPRNGGILRAVAADGPLQHGLNPSWNVLDEIHAHKDDGLYTALTKSGAAREQMLTHWITTAGPEGESLLSSLYGQMIAGTGELERRGDSLMIYRDKPNGILIFWYGAPKDADPHDPAVWMASNPASWLQDGTWLRQQHGSMISRGALLDWRIYHLNQFWGSLTSWLPDRAMAECAAPTVQLTPDRPIGVGVFQVPDSSAAAVAIAQRQTIRGGDRVVLRLKQFDAERATGRFSRRAVRDHLIELRAKYPKPATVDDKGFPIGGPAYAFERWQFEETAQELEAFGLNMVDFPQTGNAMGPASTQAYQLITTKKLLHAGDAQLVAQMEASQATLTDRGLRVVPAREEPYNHGAIASIMATAMALLPAPKVYEKKPRTGLAF